MMRGESDRSSSLRETGLILGVGLKEPDRIGNLLVVAAHSLLMCRHYILAFYAMLYAISEIRWSGGGPPAT